MSPIAVSTAGVFSRKEPITLRPRPPQPRSPSRTAELACVPNTTLGFRIVTPAATAAAPRNSRRSAVLVLGSVIESSPRCRARSGPGLRNLARQALHVLARGANVRHALLAGLPLDAQVAGEARARERREEALPVHLAGAE